MDLNFQKAQFLQSAPGIQQCPPDEGAEVAFAGRSNAGKSSAINTLTRSKKMARTSKTPGRTQLINFFALSDSQRLVDLPGYGFAKVPQAVKREWQEKLDEYLQMRQSLKGIVLLVDIRHPLQNFDTMMIRWCIEAQMPCHVLLTKADKLKRGPAKNAVLKLKKSWSEHVDLLSFQPFSSLNGEGLDRLESRLNDWLGQP